MIRTAIVGVFLSLCTILLGPPLIAYALLTGKVDLLYCVGLGAVKLVTRLVGVRVRVEGLEHIPPGVCLFVANHTSAADPAAVVGAIPRRIAILAKDSLFRIPIVGRVFYLAQFVPVDRANPAAAKASLERAIATVKQGISFLIYPEGTRSPDGRLQPFRKGSFIVAIKAGVPIVPVACIGAHRVMRKGELRLHPGEILVRFCPPVDAAAFSAEQREALLERVHAEVAKALPPDQKPQPAAGGP